MSSQQGLKNKQQQQKRKVAKIILHFRRADPMRVYYEELDRKIADLRKQGERQNTKKMYLKLYKVPKMYSPEV